MRANKFVTVLAALLLPLVAGAEDLSDVIRSSDRDAALAAMSRGADVNARQGDGSTPLLWAVYRVDHELVKTLLARGAKPNVRNLLGATPLCEAVSLGDLALVEMLLQARADPNLGNEDNQTPLMIAARIGSLPVVQALVKAGARVNEREKLRQQTALMWAIAGSSTQIVDFLIQHKAEVDVRAAATDWGNQITSEPRAQYRPAGGLTPLLYATRAGCLDCVKSLVKAGADINRPSPEGVTPLMNAIDNASYPVAHFLLDQGANPHIADWYGRTAVYLAVDMRMRGGSVGGPSGFRPTDGLASKFQPDALQMLQRLLEMGVDPNPQLNMHRAYRGRFSDDLLTTGCTPLLRAAVPADHDAVALLLKHGALPDLPNVMGVTPLMATSGIGLGIGSSASGGPRGEDGQGDSIKVIEHLLKAGADINARITDTSSRTAVIARPSSMTSRQGQTAIFGAIGASWTRVAKYLIDHGARLDVKDETGKTVLDALQGKAGGRDPPVSEDMSKLITAAYKPS